MKTRWAFGRIEEFVWTDHSGSSGWSKTENYLRDTLSHCRSVGYVIQETREFVKIVQGMDSVTGNVEGSTIIAKKLIRSRRTLRKK